MSKVKHSLEKEKRACNAFFEFQQASHGNRINDPRVGQIIQKLDFIVDWEKNRLASEKAVRKNTLVSEIAKKMELSVGIVQKRDLMDGSEKNRVNCEKRVLDSYFQEIGRKIGDLWRKARQSKNGEAFRQFAWAAEFTTPQKPDWQFACYIKLMVEQGMLSMPPVTALVKVFNNTWRHQVQPRPPITSYVQMDRICKALDCPTPKKQRMRKTKRS